MPRRNWGQTPISFRNRGLSPVFPILFCLLAGAAHAQERTIELGVETIRYSLRADPVDGGALATARHLARALVAGDIEAASLLSNAPRHRYGVLHAYRDWVGAKEFERVYAQYFSPRSKVVAEITIGRHCLLVWRLDGSDRLAGQFYAEVGDRYLLDDVPSAMRGQLRLLLEAYREGRLDK